MFESLSTHIYFFTKLFISSIIERFALVSLSSQRELLVLEDYVLNIAKDTTGPRVEWSHQIKLFLGHITITSCCTSYWSKFSSTSESSAHVSINTTGLGPDKNCLNLSSKTISCPMVMWDFRLGKSLPLQVVG